MDIQYLAGYFDGEGSISIQKWEGVKRPGSNVTTSYQLHIKVTNTYRVVLGEFQQRFGGKVMSRGVSKQFPNSRPVYDWAIGGKLARTFLTEILPYLVEKRPQAELTLQMPYNRDWHRSFTDRKRSPEEKALQERIYQEVKRLKYIRY